jgi:hypothetical protein
MELKARSNSFLNGYYPGVRAKAVIKIAKMTGAPIAWTISVILMDVTFLPIPIIAPQSPHPTKAWVAIIKALMIMVPDSFLPLPFL